MKNVVGEPGPLDITIDLGNGKGSKQIYFDNLKVEEGNAIKMELELFIQSVLKDEPTAVTAEEGLHALEVAHQVMEKLNASLNILA